MKSQYLQEMMTPVDAERFLVMTQVFQNAARVPLLAAKGPGYHPKDIPMNRGLCAVMGAMRDAGVGRAQATGTMSRIMNMGDIFEAPERFGHFIRLGRDGGDGIEVADALLKAAAVARVLNVDGRIRFDLDDVLAHAQRFEAAEDAEEGSATA